MMLIRLLRVGIGFPESSVATYILDSGVLVDLALQVFEDTLPEKRVCRHDV